jgi:RimJ/RimL family protein N-acetyltransferase
MPTRKVMEHFPTISTSEESDAGVDRIVARMEAQGFGLLAVEHWGRGYATEGARASLVHAFGPLRRDEVVSYTTTANQRSRHVMEKLGLVRRPQEDFDHPGAPPSWSGRRHVLYGITRDEWRRAMAAPLEPRTPTRDLRVT